MAATRRAENRHAAGRRSAFLGRDLAALVHSETMKISDVSRAFVGAVMVYVVMAACSGSERGNIAGGGGSSGASGEGGGAPHDGGLLDAITNPIPDAWAESGSRLKAKYWKAEDGARGLIPYTWRDSQRGEDCDFGLASDGTTRCLPMSLPVSYYDDAACTVPLLSIPKTGVCGSYKYAALPTAIGCNPATGPRIMPVANLLNVATVYAKDADGKCALKIALPSLNYYSVGAEIPPSSFVAGAVEIDP
jgi:hypothetical protein